MSVSFITATENIQAADPQNFNITIDAATRGILLYIAHATTGSDIINGVTVGGVTMERPANGFGDDVTGEPGAGYIYFLGSGLPASGVQSVSIDRADSTTLVWAVPIQLGGNADLEIVDVDNTQQGDPNLANPSVTLNHGGRECLDFFGGYDGVNSPGSITDAANQTRIHDHDFGSQAAVVSRKDAVSTSDTTLSFTVNINSLALIGVAIAEVQSAVASYVLTRNDRKIIPLI